MNKCKGCVYWKWAKADRRHHCEKNKETTCKRRAGEKEHYRITIDLIVEPDGVDRCGDIDHLVYLNRYELVPYWVHAENVQYKVELLSDEAEKDLELTWEDIQRIVEIADDILLDPQRPRQLSTTKEVYYTEVLKRFKKEQK